VVACGRRWGKTLMAGTLAIDRANHGGLVAWVVPTYKNARAPWRFAERHVGAIGRIHRAERVIEIGAGSLAIYSADNDVALRGEAFDLVIVDEAARIAEETYTDVLLPTLADRDGRIVLISTPKGRNWFWREWVRGITGEPDYWSFQAPSAANPLPTIRRAAERARDLVSDRTYRQEWLAEFVEDGGGVFRGVRALATVPPGQPPSPGHVHVIGVDWGKIEDYTAMVVLDVTAQRVVALDRSRRVEYAIQRARLRALAERYGAVTIVAELNAMGQPIVEELLRDGLPVRGVTLTAGTKATLMDALALAIEQQRITLLDDPVLIAELEAYEATPLPSGATRYRAPAGMHDDTVIALALAWSAIGHTRNSLRGAFG